MNKVLVCIVAHKALSEQLHVLSEYGTCLISKILAIQSLQYHLWDVQHFVSIWKIGVEQCCTSRITGRSAACKRPDTNIFLIEMGKWCLFFWLFAFIQCKWDWGSEMQRQRNYKSWGVRIKSTSCTIIIIEWRFMDICSSIKSRCFWE